MNKQEIKTKFQCIVEKMNNFYKFSMYDYISFHFIKPCGSPTLNDSVYFLLVGSVCIVVGQVLSQETILLLFSLLLEHSTYTVNSRYNDTIGSQQNSRRIEFVSILNFIETRRTGFIYMYLLHQALYFYIILCLK
ncbi:hypothetical protein ACF0H5_020420 [Mactra antiquata]